MMKAAVLKQFGQPLAVEERPVPIPRPGEALIRVMASGLCMTDCHIQDGMIASVRLPYIPGHEMAGIVEAFAPGTDSGGITPGTHVVCGIDITCGRCALCYGKRENLCRQRVRIGFERDGSHAEYAVVPVANLYPIADHVPFEQACVIPDAVACMYHAVADIGQVQPGERAMVFGVGGLGLQGVQMLRHRGAEVIAVARSQAKLDEARRLGAQHVIRNSGVDLACAVSEVTGGEMADVIFDLVGRQETYELLLNCLRPGGRIVGMAYAAPQFAGNYQELVIKEKQILGLRGSTRQNMRDVIRMVEEGVLVPTVTGRYRLEEINRALDDLRESRGLGRSVLTFEAP